MKIKSIQATPFHHTREAATGTAGSPAKLQSSPSIYRWAENYPVIYSTLFETAIIRIEQLYPLDEAQIVATVKQYPNARTFVWCQEESQNMGGWTFVAPRLQELMKTPFQYVGRDSSASTATGSHRVHDREQAELVSAAIGAALPHLVSAHPVVSAVNVPLKQGVH